MDRCLSPPDDARAASAADGSPAGSTAAGPGGREYWSRVLISAKGGVLQVAQADSSGISVGLNLEVRSILPLIYRKGQLQTGLALTDLRAGREGDSLRVRVRMERQGGAAYVGTAKGALLDEKGNQVSKFEQPIAIYYTAEPFVHDARSRDEPRGVIDCVSNSPPNGRTSLPSCCFEHQ